MEDESKSSSSPRMQSIPADGDTRDNSTPNKKIGTSIDGNLTKRNVQSVSEIQDLLRKYRHSGPLRQLSLKGVLLGEKGLQDLIELLERLPYLTSLSLASANLDGSDVIQICEALKASNPLLRSLDLQRNKLFEKAGSDEWEDVLASIFAIPSLTNLSLWQTGITDRVAETLARQFSTSTTISKLNLTHNKLRDAGCLALVQALDTSSLTVLNLTNNEIGVVGFRKLQKVAATQSTRYRIQIIFNNKTIGQHALYTDPSASWQRGVALSKITLDTIRKAKNISHSNWSPKKLADLIDLIRPTVRSEQENLCFHNVNQCREQFEELNAALRDQVEAKASEESLADVASKISAAEDALSNALRDALNATSIREKENATTLAALSSLIGVKPISTPLPPASFAPAFPTLEEKKKRLSFGDFVRYEELKQQLQEKKSLAADLLANLESTLDQSHKLSQKLLEYDHVGLELCEMQRESSIVAQARVDEIQREQQALFAVEAEWTRLDHEISSNKHLRLTVPDNLRRLKQVVEEIYGFAEKEIRLDAETRLLRLKKMTEKAEEMEMELRKSTREKRQLERERTHLRRALKRAKSLFPHLATEISEQDEFIDDDFLVQRSLQDYSARENLSHTVIKATDPDGRRCILKSFSLDSRESEKFKTEVDILRKLSSLRSSLIVPIHLVFQHEGKGYIQMPFYELGDMRRWLAQEHRSHDTIRGVLYLVCQAVRAIHQERIIHRDLKLDNVVMKDELTPVLIDFDVSKDEQFITKTMTMVGTQEYVAPEVLQGKPHTFSSDIYSLGILIYKCFFTAPFVSLAVGLPQHPDSNLLNLLELMLSVDPSTRISCEDVTVHPFFTTPAERKLAAEGELPDSKQKLESVKEMCRIMRTRWSNHVLELTLHRDDVVTPTLASLSREVGSSSRLLVNFQGEQGIDAGGLTSAMYRLFFEQMLDPKHQLFVKSPDASVYLPHPRASSSAMRTVGYMIARCLLDARAASIPLAPSVWRWILRLPFCIGDLEAVDQELHKSYSRILTQSVDRMGLTVDVFIHDEEDDTPVTDQNKHAIVLRATKYRLEDSIKEQLEALRTGFFSIDGLSQLLKLLSIADLKTLLCGEELLTADAIIGEIEFENFDANSPTPELLKQWLRAADTLVLRQFLIFVTEMPNIPAHGYVQPNGSSRKITVFQFGSETQLPISHTCSLQLDLPPYSTFELLSSKLELALQETRFAFA